MVGTAVIKMGVPAGRISASAAISAALGRVASSEKLRAKSYDWFTERATP
jgi:hypothetical protein